MSSVCPPVSLGVGVLGNIFAGSDVPKLPHQFKLLNEKDLRAWIVPKILKDLVERGLPPSGTVKWGHPDYRQEYEQGKVLCFYCDFLHKDHG